MKERKFMIRNSKCFTDMIAHIHKQLLRLLPRWEPTANLQWARSTFTRLRHQPFCRLVGSAGSSLDVERNHPSDLE